MSRTMVAGNWKMNLTLQQGVELVNQLCNDVKTPHCKVVIGVPFIHLTTIADIIKSKHAPIAVAAENCADKEKGAFTGEVSAEQVASTGATYCILGHSERRAYYHETNAILAEKVKLALANNLKVIFCVGETKEQREANEQEKVVTKQLNEGLFFLTDEQFENIVVAYEPVWAIGTGLTATPDQAQEIHSVIRTAISEKYGVAVGQRTTILYGGSCNPKTAPELFSKPDIDGGLIGGASLKAPDFEAIINAR